MRTLSGFIGFVALVLASSHATSTLAQIPAPPPPLTPFTQDFEGLDQSNPSALGDDGWVVSGLVFDEFEVFRFFYGNFAAPNAQPGEALSNIESGQGGPEQGLQYLNVFSDYNCCDLALPTPIGHGNGTDIVESNVFQEQTIGTENIGEVYTFSFDATLPGGDNAQFAIDNQSEGIAFIRTLDPNAGFATTNFITFDALTLSSTEWTSHQLQIDLSDPLLDGQILQFGFQTRSSDFNPTGIYFDNISFLVEGGGQEGDFDGDGDVDGNDFLVYQRDLGDATSLSAFLANYGATPPVAVSAATAVPEPSSALIALIGALCLGGSKRRR